MTEPTVQIDSKGLCLLWKGDNLLEKGVFTWNDLVSPAKSSIKSTLNHFWKIFSFSRNVSTGETFTSYDWITFEMAQLDYASSSERMNTFLEKSVFTWNDLASAVKRSKECFLNHFWQIFSFFGNFRIGQTFTSYD